MRNFLLGLFFIPLVFNNAFADGSKVQCPSQNFNSFIKQFANDEEMQRKFTSNPMTYVYLDDSGEAIKTKKTLINPVTENKRFFYPEYKQDQWTLKTKITKKNNYAYRVTVHVDNSRPHYDFIKKSGCWYLNRYTNLSL